MLHQKFLTRTSVDIYGSSSIFFPYSKRKTLENKKFCVYMPPAKFKNNLSFAGRRVILFAEDNLMKIIGREYISELPVFLRLK